MSDLSAILQLLTEHPRLLLVVAGWYIFQNLASSLPSVDEVAQALPGRPVALLVYKTVFHLMQALAGNLARIIPGLRMLNWKEKP